MNNMNNKNSIDNNNEINNKSIDQADINDDYNSNKNKEDTNEISCFNSLPLISLYLYTNPM